MEKDTAADVVADSARMREETARKTYTIADAIDDARWLRRTPDGVLSPDRSKQVIDTLLAALEASPCYFKGARLGIPTFTLIAYDLAGQIAILKWAEVAEAHGCRHEKVQDALAKVTEWGKRT